MNYIEERHYVYELYKDGQPYKKSHRTDSRYCQFTLDQSGKYRIRVTPDTDNVKARFSQTYAYKSDSVSTGVSTAEHAEMPDNKNEWMLSLIIDHMNIKGIVGNPYKYPEGFKGMDVYQKEEMKAPYIKRENLPEISLALLEDMSKEKLATFVNVHKETINRASEAMQKYINFLQQ